MKHFNEYFFESLSKESIKKLEQYISDENESLIKDKERLMEELEKMKQKSKENEERLNKKINNETF